MSSRILFSMYFILLCCLVAALCRPIFSVSQDPSLMASANDSSSSGDDNDPKKVAVRQTSQKMETGVYAGSGSGSSVEAAAPEISSDTSSGQKEESGGGAAQQGPQTGVSAYSSGGSVSGGAGKSSYRLKDEPIVGTEEKTTGITVSPEEDKSKMMLDQPSVVKSLDMRMKDEPEQQQRPMDNSSLSSMENTGNKNVISETHKGFEMGEDS
uniref:Uncharacterized protein n=1 Tax=Ditylenchus dipsaci TaxID=166011 RepID=A0A915EGI6_9BILA